MNKEKLKFFLEGWERFISKKIKMSKELNGLPAKEQAALDKSIKKWKNAQSNLSFYHSMNDYDVDQYQIYASKMEKSIDNIISQIREHILPFFKEKEYIILDDNWNASDKFWYADRLLTYNKDTNTMYLNYDRDIGYGDVRVSTALEKLEHGEILRLFEEIRCSSKKKLERTTDNE